MKIYDDRNCTEVNIKVKVGDIFITENGNKYILVENNLDKNNDFYVLNLDDLTLGIFSGNQLKIGYHNYRGEKITEVINNENISLHIK